MDALKGKGNIFQVFGLTDKDVNQERPIAGYGFFSCSKSAGVLAIAFRSILTITVHYKLTEETFFSSVEIS